MKKLKLLLSAAVLAAILVRPEDSVAGAQRAMLLWCTSVAPSLFPFLALMPVLTGSEACRAYNKIFSGLMGRLFHLPGSAAPAVVIGMIAGSPGGAIAVRRVSAETGMKNTDARRLALALTGLSPAYLVLGVGCGLYGSAQMGWKLAAIQAFIQIALLICLQGFDLGDGAPVDIQESSRTGGMLGAVESVLVICGYMVFFSAIASVLAGFLGYLPGALLLLAMDLPSGLAELARVDIPARELLQCMGIGLGGLCIAAQNMDVMREIGVKAGDYLCVRCIAAALFACIGAIVLRNSPSMPGTAPNSAPAYVISMFFAGAMAIPGIFFLSKNMILNKSKFAKNGAGTD
ncbi:MAG: hypothetical protein IJ466_08850 [Clostridia bacterium]|nr:hypothetical protein [Clostridia bacterium]